MHLPSLVTKPLVQPSNFAFGSPTKRPQIRTPPQESKDLSLTRVCLSHINRGGAKAQLKHPLGNADGGQGAASGEVPMEAMGLPRNALLTAAQGLPQGRVPMAAKGLPRVVTLRVVQVCFGLPANCSRVTGVK